MDILRFKAGFENPDRRYAIYPILHHNSFDRETVDTVQRRGFAGVVGNLKYTREFPNDNAEWQTACDGFKEYIKRGMHAWIYDEHKYPSGTARGYVTESNPDLVAKGLYCYKNWRVLKGPLDFRADIPDENLYKALLIPTGEGEIIDVSDSLNENGVLYFDVPEGSYYLFIMTVRRLFDGTHSTESWAEPRNYISLADRDAVRAFIECTHDNYKKHLKDEFGKGILAMFTDEPSLTSWQITHGIFPILPWHHTFDKDFKERYGYDFMYACVAVVLEKGEDVIKRRCDFWDFIADEVANTYFAAIQDWCHENNLKASGHMLREERLQAHVYCYGSFFRSMKKFDWPGIDQLETDIQALMSDDEIPIARFIASFADINGEREAFTEFSDILKYRESPDGKIAPIKCYYDSVNWHHAMGVNNFTSYYTLRGLTDGQLYDLNTYTARSGYLLRQGIRDSRVAVFYPEAAIWSAYTPTAAKSSYDSSERTTVLDKTFAKSAWELLHRQIDFDYVDRDILVSAVIENGKLNYRDRSYSAVVIPCARVLEEDAMQRLIELQEAGISVMFTTEMPSVSRNSGKEHPLCDELYRRVRDGRMLFEPDVDRIGELYDKALTDDCRSIVVRDSEGGLCENILSHSRVTDDGGRIVYVANMSENEFSGTLTVLCDADAVYDASPSSGDIRETYFKRADGSSVINIRLASGEAKLFLL